MEVIRNTAEVMARLSELRRSGEQISLVPTMGFLHEGHLSLVKLAKGRPGKTVVTIFVNPTQFNEASDLEAYPRDEPRDLELLEGEGVDLVFIPDVLEVYPEDFATKVEVSGLTDHFEGASRPGHFTGVTTVVTLLFTILRPDRAVFGEKDFQQLRVIEQMVSDLRLGIEIVRGPLIREGDGLAMSSRNVLLSDETRQIALTLSKALEAGLATYQAGERSAENIRNSAIALIDKQPEIKLHYLEVADEATLQRQVGELVAPSRLLIAATVGNVRLIDNISLTA